MDFVIKEKLIKEVKNYLNIFAVFKFMVVKKTIAFFFQKNYFICPVKKYNTLYLLYKSDFLKKHYIRFVNFMYSLFYAKATVFFFFF